MTFKYVILAVEIFFLLLFIAPFPILNAGNIAGIAFFGILIAATAAHAHFSNYYKFYGHTRGAKALSQL